jgi:uncharacterized protein (TIGR03435 family)
MQLQGGPAWIDLERLDIVAKADTGGGEIKWEDWAHMLRALLEDRFKLAVHKETKETSVYVLVVEKANPNIRASASGDEKKTTFVPGAHGQMTFEKMPMVGLAGTIANILHIPVVDRTGLTGFFDFTLDPMKFASVGDSGSPRFTADTYADLVMVAVREQLGLKMEKRKEPLEVMVIDHVEKPSDN